MIKSTSHNTAKINITLKTSEAILCLGFWVKARLSTKPVDMRFGVARNGLSISGFDAGVSESN